MSKPLNITIVSHYLPPHIGGIEMVAYRQAQEYMKRGHHVTSLSSHVSGTDPTPALGKRHDVVQVGVWNGLEKFGVPFPLFSIKIWSETIRTIKRSDIVHVHDGFYISSLVAAIVARYYKKPLFVTQHVALIQHSSRLVRFVQKAVYATTGRFIFHQAQIIYVINERVADFLVSLGIANDKIHRTVNGVDTELFHPPVSKQDVANLRDELGLPPKRKLVLLVGRLAPKKGYHKLLAAMDGSYDVVLAGSQNLPVDIKLNQHIHHLGTMDQATLAKVYRASDAFVLPSESEGFPLSVQEAMASGLPVITSWDEGYRTYDIDKQLVWFIPASVSEVKKAISKLFGDYAKIAPPMAAYGRRYAASAFSWKSVCGTMLGDYQQAQRPAKPLIVTTSWDDGHEEDLRLAELLKKYGLSGTFYISPKDREIAKSDRLTDSQIKDLSQNFEIGAHTMTHPRLTTISDKEAEKEIDESRIYLEKVTGRPVTTFCYPGGNYLARHAQLVKKLGFHYARTTKRYQRQPAHNSYEAETTVNTYNHFQDWFNMLRVAHFNPVKAVRYFQWDKLAIAMYDQMKLSGGVYHLWGHSWMEINRQKNGWQRLEKVFAHIAGNADATYAVNGKLPTLAPKTLLVVAPYFPPHTGGQEFYAQNICLGLQTTFDWRVVVVTSGKRGWQRVITRNENGLQIYEVPYLFKLFNSPVHPLWWFMLRKIIKDEQPSVINGHAPVPFMADVASAASGKVPFVLTYHMLSMRKGKLGADGLIWLYEHVLLPHTAKKAAHIICASEAVQAYWPFMRTKSTVVEPGVDLQRFSKRPKTAGGHHLLFNGTIDTNAHHKGLAVLLEALALIGDTVPDVELRVVGRGTGQAHYEQLATTLGISNKVKFLGTKFDSDLVKEFHAADVYIQPSLMDNYPMAVLEAMASSLPVVATGVGAIPSIVADKKEGYIVAAGDAHALANKIDALLRDPKKAARFGLAARHRAEQTMDWSIKTALTNDVYEKVREGL